MGGTGYNGFIKVIEFYRAPLTNEEAKLKYRRLGSCVGGC